MLGSEALRDLSGVRELVQVILDEADRERLDRPARVARHQRHDQARVDPTAQHRAERHIAHQPEPHRFLELGEETFRVLVRTQPRSGAGSG